MFDAAINFLIFLKVRSVVTSLDALETRLSGDGSLQVLFLLVVVTDKDTLTLLHRIAPIRLRGATSENVLDAFSKPIRGVFSSSVKLAVFYGLYTSVLHPVFARMRMHRGVTDVVWWIVIRQVGGVSTLRVATVADSDDRKRTALCCSFGPCFRRVLAARDRVLAPGTHGVQVGPSLPRVSLVWPQDEFGTALLLGVAGVWLWWGAAAESIYSDIPNSPHPYLTGLSVIGVGCCRSCAMAACVSVRR